VKAASQLTVPANECILLISRSVHPADMCGLGSIYGFLQGAWPFGVVEAVWMVVAFRRWALYRLR